MKPITPKLHGVLDYSSVGLMLAAPSLLKLKGPARTLSYIFAGTYLGVSLFTDMPLGLKRAIPFPTHGTIEASSIPALLALPVLLGAFHSTTERAYFGALAATVLGAYTLTDWQGDTQG